MDATEHAKVIFLIRRREGVTRDELIMHWYKNHMPAVIASNLNASSQGLNAASRYIAQLFLPDDSDSWIWDGMAQLWFSDPLPPMSQAAGSNPSDTFQQKAEPYWNWATKEYVVREGSEMLSEEPLTLNEPYPSTRSGFFRVNYLVGAKQGIDYSEFYEHWLQVHVPNVESVLDGCGGFRYVVSHSLYPDRAPYAGMAELYFHGTDGLRKFQSHIKPDGMERWMDPHIMRGNTEMIGIP